MPTQKATMLQNILSDAADAKPIPGMKNTYTPGEYNKLMQAQQLEAQLESSDGFWHSNPAPGAVEFDERSGNLRRINRNAPKMLDLNIYAANRYMVEKEEHEEPVLDKEGKETGKTKTVYDKFDLLLVLGIATTRAIDNKTELPKSVIAYRFTRVKDHFEYVKKELISDKVAYEMVHTLNPLDCLRLREQIKDTDLDSKLGGDTLNDVLKK